MASNKKRNIEEVVEGGVGRASWKKEVLHIFCDVCIEFAEKSKGQHGATISQRMPWKILATEFHKRTNLEYKKDQLKHKWDWMKSRWTLWKALKRNETGLGWDYEKRKISASEEWWNRKIEENSNFKSFKDEGFEPELESKMEQLFGFSVAQGENKFTPSQREKEVTSILNPSPNTSAGFTIDEDEDDDEIEEVGAFNTTETTQKWKEVWNVDDDAFLTGSSQGRKRALENETPESSKTHNQKSTKKKGAGVLMEQLNAMVKVVTERNAKDMELMDIEAHAFKDNSISLADSLAKLVSLPGLFPGSPEFCFACTLIEDSQKRIILDGIPDDVSRLQWIKYLYEKSEKKE